MTWKNFRTSSLGRTRRCLGLALALGLAPPVLAAGDGDPIGQIGSAVPYEGDARVAVGPDADGHPVCFTRETGDNHRLDIGIGTAGAFVRLEAADSDGAAAMPQAPLQIYAGEQQVADGKATDRFNVLKAFTGTARFLRFTGPAPGFVVVADGNPAPFLEVVAAARRQFLVVASQQDPRAIDYVAVYDFTPEAAGAVIACATRHVPADAPAQGTPHLAPALPASLW